MHAFSLWKQLVGLPFAEKETLVFILSLYMLFRFHYYVYILLFKLLLNTSTGMTWTVRLEAVLSLTFVQFFKFKK